MQHATALGLITGLEPFQAVQILDAWPRDLVTRAMAEMDAETVAAVRPRATIERAEWNELQRVKRFANRRYYDYARHASTPY